MLKSISKTTSIYLFNTKKHITMTQAQSKKFCYRIKIVSEHSYFVQYKLLGDSQWIVLGLPHPTLETAVNDVRDNIKRDNEKFEVDNAKLVEFEL